MAVNITITSNIDQVRRQMGSLARQVDFAASKALNATARQVQRAIPAGLQRQLDRPTPFTTGNPDGSRASTYLQPAKKNKLEVGVMFKDTQAAYLRFQVEGGIRAPKGKALRLPSAIGLDAYGNLPRGAIAKLLAVARREGKLGKRTAQRIKVGRGTSIFYGDPADVGAHRFPPGIYKEVIAGTRRQLIPLIVFPARTATYRTRVDLVDIASPVIAREFEPQFRQALDAALKDSMS